MDREYKDLVKTMASIGSKLADHIESQDAQLKTLQEQVKELEREQKVLFGVVNDAQNEAKELETDASRYRWLRKDDNWGDDSDGDSWDVLGEASGCEFDNIVDAKSKAMGG